MRYVCLALVALLSIATPAFNPAAADVIINMPGATTAKPQPQSAQPITNATNAPPNTVGGTPGIVPPIRGGSTFPPSSLPNPNAPGFQTACTKMWCREGLTINLPMANTPGQYRFVVLADGERYTCTGTLPLNRCGTPSSSCDRPGIFVGENGCALPPQAQTFSTLFIDKVPQTVEVDVTLPGRQPIHVAGPTAPQCFYPNGQQCDPRPCCQAQVTVGQ